jgi:hypothetical protein
MTSVYLFNASALPIQLTIRSGKPFTITGTSRTTLWRPAIPVSEPGWGATNPAPGQLGFGNNEVMVTNGQNTVTLNINVPTSVLPTTSLQIYFYYSPPSNESPEPAAYWVGLNDALPFGGSVKNITASLKE